MWLFWQLFVGILHLKSGMMWAGSHRTNLWISHSFWPSQTSSSSHPPSKTGGSHMDPPIDWDLPRDNPVIGDVCDKMTSKETWQVTSKPCDRSPDQAWQREIRAASFFQSFGMSSHFTYSFEKKKTSLSRRPITRFRNLEVLLLNDLGCCENVGESWVPWKPCLFNTA